MWSWRRPDRLEEKLMGPPRLGERAQECVAVGLVHPKQCSFSTPSPSTPAWAISLGGGGGGDALLRKASGRHGEEDRLR